MSEPDTPATPAPDPAPARCANCGTVLRGKYCHDCGQPIEGLVRHFSSVMSDVVDSVFNIDERLFRTVWPLYVRPGRLTLEYFAGRRTRYVTPFRLVFSLAIVAFFVIQFVVGLSFDRGNTRIFTVDSPGIHVTRSEVAGNARVPAADARSMSPETLAWWNHTIKTLHFAWLPEMTNDWLRSSAIRIRDHIQRLAHGTTAQRKAESKQIVSGMFAVAPTVLFVLLPIFALLLKLFYLFKRRLYMEHLIVAMHSHAFIMLSMLVLVVLSLLRAWLLPHAAWLDTPFALLNAAAWLWIIVYLLLMQKRVYRQGWVMTCVKFGGIGACYGVLLAFALSAASLIALAH